MFVLIAGKRSADAEGLLERMAAELLGAAGSPRLWRDAGRDAAAASLVTNFVPEDALDVQPIVDEERVFVCQARLDNRDELQQQLGIGSRMADSSLLAAAYAEVSEGAVTSRAISL